MLRTHHSAPAPRKGVILLVVIILLTLFAVVGLTFVLYSDSSATSGRIYRESFTVLNLRPDESPSVLLNFGLSQIIFPVDDNQNPYTALRGWDLARDMYGWDDDFPTRANGTAVNNTLPFNGTGRLHTHAGIYQNPFTGGVSPLLK